MDSFGKKLEALRKTKNLSQKQLAEEAGISPSYLSRVERGKRNIPHPGILKKMATPLGLSEAEILILAGYLPEPTAPASIPGHWSDLIADPSLDGALRQLGTLTNEEKLSLAMYLRAIKLQRESTS